MTILLIDIGNSYIKWAILQDGEILYGSSHSYSLPEMALDWIADIETSPGAIYMISVGHDLAGLQLAAACQVQWGLQPIHLRTGSYCAGVSNGYGSPLTLGIDRWAAMIGAYILVHTAVLVIDCGTACSVDVVNENGRHLGGALIPGLQLMRQSLQSGTACIDIAVDKGIVPLLGVSTSGCVLLGVNEALLGFIARMEQLAIAQVGSPVAVVITGGGAPELLPFLPPNVHFEHDLVFRGMATMVSQYAS